MDVLDFKNIYWNYYRQIEKDFFDTVPYCGILLYLYPTNVTVSSEQVEISDEEAENV